MGDRVERDGIDDQLTGVLSLADPKRRSIYRLVTSSEVSVSKDSVAKALGMARSVAAFHLDRLVQEGLLVADYRRLTGRTGPGAGRPAKLYSRSGSDIDVTLPARRYRLAAELLAVAITAAQASGATTHESLARVARDRGRQWGERVRALTNLQADHPTVRGATLEMLGEQGFEPRTVRSEVTLTNCPFQPLADEHRDLICGMNYDLLTGLCETLPDTALSARLHPSPGYCCVRLDDHGADR